MLALKMQASKLSGAFQFGVFYFFSKIFIFFVLMILILIVQLWGFAVGVTLRPNN